MDINEYVGMYGDLNLSVYQTTVFGSHPLGPLSPRFMGFELRMRIISCEEDF